MNDIELTLLLSVYIYANAFNETKKLKINSVNKIKHRIKIDSSKLFFPCIRCSCVWSKWSVRDYVNYNYYHVNKTNNNK